MPKPVLLVVSSPKTLRDRNPDYRNSIRLFYAHIRTYQALTELLTPPRDDCVLESVFPKVFDLHRSRVCFRMHHFADEALSNE